MRLTSFCIDVHNNGSSFAYSSTVYNKTVAISYIEQVN